MEWWHAAFIVESVVWQPTQDIIRYLHTQPMGDRKEKAEFYSLPVEGFIKCLRLKLNHSETNDNVIDTQLVSS